jgi:hypothetical protein
VAVLLLMIEAVVVLHGFFQADVAAMWHLRCVAASIRHSVLPLMYSVLLRACVLTH